MIKIGSTVKMNNEDRQFIQDCIKYDIENHFHIIFPNRSLEGEWFDKLVQTAFNDCYETVDINEYTGGDIGLYCERALLKCLCCEDI
jgi:hypothetical protein